VTLRDRMVYAGLRTSRRFAELNRWIERDFFYGLLHVADDFGRFEADVGMLRAVLFAPVLHKVSERDVASCLVRVHEVGLVKLYTVGGRGYGKVLNFRQTGLKTRRALYPDEDGAPAEPELFAAPAEPSAVLPQKERKKETPHSPPPAGGGDADAFETKPAKAAAYAGKAKVNFRRAQRLDTLAEERERLEAEMREILRPGGCAYNVMPTGPKAERLEQLKAAHAELVELIAKRRRELAQEDTA
jgi:hypothetical protein